MSQKTLALFTMLIPTLLFAITDAQLRREVELFGWNAERIRSVISEKKTSFYPEVLPRLFGRSDLSTAEKTEFTKAFAPIVAASPALQTIVANDFLYEDRETKEREVRLSLAEHEFIMGKVLFEAGQLKNVKKLTYAGGKVMELNSADQFDQAKFIDWVIKNQVTDLFPGVLLIRSRLDAKSSPTREEVTRKIQEVVEKGEPAVSTKMLDALEKSMVASRPPWGGDPGPNKGPRSFKTLVVSLRDGGDLALGRLLLANGRLNGIQRVAYPGLVDRHIEKDGKMWTETNFIPENMVYDEPGKRVADLLKQENYRPAPAGLHGRGSEGFWRVPRLMSESSFFRPSAYVGCEDLPKLAPQAGASSQAAAK